MTADLLKASHMHRGPVRAGFSLHGRGPTHPSPLGRQRAAFPRPTLSSSEVRREEDMVADLWDVFKNFQGDDFSMQIRTGLGMTNNDLPHATLGDLMQIMTGRNVTLADLAQEPSWSQERATVGRSFGSF